MQTAVHQIPFSIDELEGQPIALRYLKNYTRQPEKLPPLLVFHGPSGVGKNFAAERFIYSMLCFERTGCGACPSCRQFLKKSHPDFIAFPESERIAIGDEKDPKEFTIRWLHSQRIVYTPQLSEIRYVYFPDATKINHEAETALLKLLEDAPAHTRFLFLVEDIHSLKSTIRSRSVLIPFHYLPVATVHSIAQKQNIYLHEFQGGSLETNFMEPAVWESYRTMVENNLFDSILLLKLEAWVREHKTKHPEWNIDFDYRVFLEIVSSLMLYEYSRNNQRDNTEAMEAIFEFKKYLHYETNAMESFIISRLFSRLSHLTL